MMNIKHFLTAGAMSLAASMAVAQETGEMTKVVMMHTAASVYVVPYVAADQGFFQKHGVDVELLKPSVSGVLISAIVSGSAQVSTPTPTVILQAMDNGIELRGISATNIFPDDTPAGLVVRAGTGIKTPADLSGKKVGVPGIGALLDVTMRKWLDENGGDSSSINIVEVRIPLGVDALRGGHVDAIASVDPFVSRAVDTGVGILIGNYLDVVEPGSAGAVLVTTAEWADAHPEAIRGMQLALRDAVEFIGKNPVGARDAIARFTTLPPAVVARAVLPNVSNIELSPDTSFSFWNNLAVEQGLIEAPIDMTDFVLPFPAE